jgi:hypothetical protein
MMMKFVKTVRHHVYPRAAIDQKLRTGTLNASSFLLGMLCIAAGMLLVAQVVMLIAPS